MPLTISTRDRRAIGVGPRLAGLIGVAGLLLLSCGRVGGGSRVNVVLISMDTTRRDHCSAYAYPLPTTPSLERLAGQGIRFDEAYSPSASTGPTHASVFTSAYPLTHRVVKNGLVLSDDFTTLAETFRSAGYQTAAFVGSFVLDAKFGYAQGFDSYDDDFAAAEASLPLTRWEGHDLEGGFDRRANRTTDLAADWLETTRDRRRPFFLFVHYFDAHDPYAPPEEFARRFRPPSPDAPPLQQVVAQYDAEIAFVDASIGRLMQTLEKLQLDGETLIVVMGDHGEGLMDHGHLLHEIHIYEEQVRVPLVMRWHGRLPAGVTVSEPVELIDLTPTILGLAGLMNEGAAWRGRNLSRQLENGGAGLDPDHPVFLYRRHFDGGMIGAIRVKGEQFGIRSANWKYIEAREENTEELFDLANDPRERYSVADEQPERVAEMAGRVARWVREETRSASAGGISDEDLERLRSLGYIE